MDIVDLFKLVTTKDSTCEHQQQQYLSPSECKSSKKTMRPFRFPQIGSSTNIPIAQSDPHRHRTLSLSNYLYNERNRRQSLAESTLTFQPVRHETLEKREILSSEKKLAVFHHNMNNHKVDTAVIHSEQDQAAQPSSPSPVSSYWNTDRIREWVVEETNSNERTTTPIIVKECNSITKNDLVDFYRRFRGETHTSTSAASFLYSNPSSSHHWYALDKYGKLIGFLFCGEKK
ncbi:unnamed protein product [Didymodactylos carnosus]|uniref:Uncharacterized protein n=1 Tax=Didymodactylos carnosus TaxID=1234261 RepID=A0A813WSN7_9BILA|nr:unnamed protein product [Didymodactylos carnosus]CAF3645706.1 unnamed protein product [Didymodactylos carnosus]